MVGSACCSRHNTDTDANRYTDVDTNRYTDGHADCDARKLPRTGRNMQEESGMLLERLHGNAGREDLPALSDRDANSHTLSDADFDAHSAVTPTSDLSTGNEDYRKCENQFRD